MKCVVNKPWVKASHVWCLLFLSLSLCVAPEVAQAQSVKQVLKIEEHLRQWNMDEAKGLIQAIPVADQELPQGLILRAQYAFLEGDYDHALKLAEAATSGPVVHPMWSIRHDMIKATREVTASYETHLSPKGYFEIKIPAGKDRVLLPYAFEALEQAYEVLGEELGVRPKAPVRVEVYPNSLTLAKVSTLTDENIRTTNTIALCTDNRILLTSPNATVQGYGWVDTVVHEYVHYVLNHKAKKNVPIWMHEGLAKFFERSWRGAGKHKLAPSSEHLLAKRFLAKNLVTFEQMHPSMAKLPSAQDASVAYAQVYTMMEYLYVQKGAAGINAMIKFINKGTDAKAAYAKALGTRFSNFEKHIWPQFLKNRAKVDYPEDVDVEKLKFKDTSLANSDVRKIAKPAARDHVNLGQMLQTRGRCEAAVVQYKKAVHVLGTKNPTVQTRMAQCLIELHKARDAILALTPVRTLFPSYVTAWHELGRAAISLGNMKDAKLYLLEAIRINPFNPDTHELLAKVYAQAGEVQLAKQSRVFAVLVR